MKKGVTLYELLIVMTIMAIIAAVITIKMSDLLPAWKLNSTASAVLNKIRHAQEEAVTTQKQNLVRFTNEADNKKIDLVLRDGTDTVLETIEFGPQISFAFDPQNASGEVVFSSDGGPSYSGNITINLETASKTINIAPSGIIKLQ